MFRDLIPALADDYHLVAPDYPGYGFSSMPNIEELLESVAEEIHNAQSTDSVYFSTIDLEYAFGQILLHPCL